MPRKIPTLVQLLKKKKRLSTPPKSSYLPESVADSPAEALRKSVVSILSGNLSKAVEKAVASDEWGSKLVGVTSSTQRFRAFWMKKLSRNPNCLYSNVSSFKRTSAAKSTAQILSTAVAGLGTYYMANYLEILPNIKEREYRETLVNLLRQHLLEAVAAQDTKIVELKGSLQELQGSFKELKNDLKEKDDALKELEKENLDLKEKNEKLETSSWFSWLFRS